MADSVVQTDYFLVLSLVVWQVHFSGLKHELPENCVKWFVVRVCLLCQHFCKNNIAQKVMHFLCFFYLEQVCEVCLICQFCWQQCGIVHGWRNLLCRKQQCVTKTDHVTYSRSWQSRVSLEIVSLARWMERCCEMVWGWFVELRDVLIYYVNFRVSWA